MQYFKTLAQSFYNPALYQQVIKETGKASRHFFKTALVLTVIYVVANVSLARQVVDFQKNMGPKLDEVAQNFPAELEVTIKDGKASTNVAQPYFVKVENPEGDEKKNYVVIDTNTPYSVDQFKTYNAYVWLTKDTLFYVSGEGSTAGSEKIESYALSEMPPTTINRQVVADFLHKAEPFLRGAIWFAIPAGIAFIYLFAMGKLLYLLILAVLVMWLAKLMQVALDYKQSYKVAIYATAPLFILDVLLLSFLQFKIPFGVTIAALVIVAANLSKKTKAKA